MKKIYTAGKKFTFIFRNLLSAKADKKQKDNYLSFKKKGYAMFICMVLLLGLGNTFGQNVTQTNFTGVITPQYMSSGTSTRLPIIFRASISGLTASTTYRYYVQGAINTDFGTVNPGAGNPLLISSSGSTYTYTTRPGLSTPGTNCESFSTGAGQTTYTGWFGIVNTGNARFTAGNTIFPCIVLGNNSGTVIARYALDIGITVLTYSTSAGATNGTFIQETSSSATAKNLVALYDNTSGTGRPLYVSPLENIGASIASVVTGYSTGAGAWNAIIPNTNANGVRRIEQLSVTTGNSVGCVATDGDGVWPSGTNTVNPTGGTTALVITSGNAPLSARPTGSVSGTATICNGGSSSISISVTGSGTISGTLSPGAIPFSGTSPTISVSVSPTGNTTYSVASLSDANCTSIAGDLTGSRVVIVNDRPTGAISGTTTICGGSATLSIAVTGSGTVSGTLSPSAIPFSGTAPTITVNVSPSSNTTYSIATMADGNCTSNAGDLSGSAVVTVNSGPTISSTGDLTVNNDATLCSATISNGQLMGQVTGISGTPAPSVTFSPPAGSFSGGSTPVIATATNSCGSSTANFNVIVNDNEAPATPTLATVTGECSATATPPTTTDNCAGTVTGTTSDALSYSTQGTHVIHWTFDDGNGNSITVNQNVIVDDVTNPATPTLADVTGECSATATTPTTTDNCAGIVTGTTSDPLSYNTQGTHVIHWTFDDGNGNSITVNQNVIILDVTDPVITCNGPVSVGNDSGFCTATVTLSTPGATDNCSVSSVVSDHPSTTYPEGTTVVTWTATDAGSNTAACTQTVTVTIDHATAPTSVTSDDADNEICSGTQVVLTANGASLGTAGGSYQWYEGGCGTGSSLSSTNTLTVTPAAGSHTYYARIEEPGCPNNTACASITIIVSGAPPSNSVGTPAGPTDACSGSVSLITVNTVGGPNVHYSWNTGSNSSVVLFSTNIGGPFSPGPYSTPTNQVYAQFGSLVASSSYHICVQGVNACGSTNNKCLVIRGTVSTPGTITPASGVVACPNDVKNYTAGVSGGATTYNWTLGGSPAAITGGQGTQNATVTFPAGFTSAQLCVTASLTCGGSSTSAPRCMLVSKTPAVPGAMSGSSKVCPGATGVTFSVPAVTGASGYTWTTPVGTTITSGQNTTSITVDFPTPYTGAPPVCVTANSPCASSAGRCKTVGSNVPGQPGAMSGATTNICGSTVQYSISAVANASTYTWTNPAGTTIASGQGSTTILLTVSSTFTSGQLTVVPSTTFCSPGTGTARTITIYGKPNVPGTITQNPPGVFCSGAFLNFSVSNPAVGPIPTYNWTVSNGTITNGQGSNNVDVTWGSGSGTVNVSASNGCGGSGVHSQTFASGCRMEGTNENSSEGFSAYPNPAHDNLTVSIDVKETTGLSIQLMDVSGRVVLSQDATGTAGLNTYDLNLT
ncbi:MAG: HYR domain-containing protein, partial [Bacteroidota bacterium]